MFGWLSRPRRTSPAAASDAAERLIGEGNRAEDAGDVARACELYRRAVAAAPQLPKAHLNLGIGLEAAGESAAARASYERALALEPTNAAALYNLGKLLFAGSAHAAAEAHLRRALELRAEFPEARIVHGYALHALGRLEEAARELRLGLRERPQDLAAAATLFHVLDALGDLEGAAAALETMLAEKPDWTEALYNYGTTLLGLKRDADAERTLARVLELEPRFRMAYRMLGSLLHRHGRVDELLALYAAGRQVLPEDFELESLELFALLFSERISEDALYERHRTFGERLERTHPARFRFAPSRAAAERRLRIGYVSADFTYHPVGLFMLPVLEHHDGAEVEVYCYAAVPKPDNFTERLKRAAHVWRDVTALGDTELASRIHTDEIDVLIDLAGHSGASRLAVFAEQPAPVQATWLGYLHSTGLRRLHYRITDRHCDPEGDADRRHTERLLRLPASQWCYRPFVDMPHAAVPPVKKNGYITFGSFNQAAKLSATTRRLWARILNALPDSRLQVVAVAAGRAADGLREDLVAAGVAAERLTIVPFVPVQKFLALHDEVDIALDPMPVSGGTTTCDALWMGVPVLTLPAVRAVSRSSASILATLGLHEWIATGQEDYAARALRAAGDVQRLGELRAALRNRMRASPLMDEARFTRDLEAAYRQMWRRWCEGGG